MPSNTAEQDSRAFIGAIAAPAESQRARPSSRAAEELADAGGEELAVARPDLLVRREQAFRTGRRHAAHEERVRTRRDAMELAREIERRRVEALGVDVQARDRGPRPDVDEEKEARRTQIE